MRFYCLMVNVSTFNTFKKYFNTEFERDKYIRRSRYFKKIRLLEFGEEYE